MYDKNFDGIERCWLCLVNGPYDYSINGVLLYNAAFEEDHLNYGTMRHEEFSEYKMGEHLIKINFDNVYLYLSECAIFVINNLLANYKKGHFSEQLKPLITNSVFPISHDNIQAFFFVLLNYSESIPNSYAYSQHLEIINEILESEHKVFVLNVKTKEGRKELMEELILESVKIQKLRKKRDNDNKKKCLCIVN